MTEIPRLLTAYADAVARRAYWKDHGHRGDGNDVKALADEREARRAVIAAIKKRVNA